MLELNVVQPTSELGHTLARRPDRLRGLLPYRLCARHARQSLIGDELPSFDIALEILDFLLSCQQACLLGVRRVEADAMPVDQVSVLDDKQAAWRQLCPQLQSRSHIRAYIDFAQPIAQQGTKIRIRN